ncbi:MAG: tetraacyldisaccharide 4'-kinase, partial [Verrucomicrobiota bacterium]
MRERWQKFTEEAETYLLAVILEDLPGRKASMIRGLLALLSHVFAGIVKLRRLLYSLRILRDATLGVQVIAVGNLTVGGTGKTPVVEKFARALQDAGRKVAILS